MKYVAKSRLIEAQQFLDDAEILYREKIGNLHTLTKLYHAMIYSLFALHHIEELGNLTHSEIIDNFRKDFVDPGTFSGTYVDALSLAHYATHACDCLAPKQPDDNDIDRIIPLARDLVKFVGEYLKKA